MVWIHFLSILFRTEHFSNKMFWFVFFMVLIACIAAVCGPEALRPTISDDIPHPLPEILTRCWAADPSARPDWSWIVESLESLWAQLAPDQPLPLDQEDAEVRSMSSVVGNSSRFVMADSFFHRDSAHERISVTLRTCRVPASRALSRSPRSPRSRSPNSKARRRETVRVVPQDLSAPPPLWNKSKGSRRISAPPTPASLVGRGGPSPASISHFVSADESSVCHLWDVTVKRPNRLPGFVPHQTPLVLLCVLTAGKASVAVTVDVGNPVQRVLSRVSLWSISIHNTEQLLSVESPHSAPLRCFVIVPCRKHSHAEDSCSFPQRHLSPSESPQSSPESLPSSNGPIPSSTAPHASPSRSPGKERGLSRHAGVSPLLGSQRVLQREACFLGLSLDMSGFLRVWSIQISEDAAPTCTVHPAINLLPGISWIGAAGATDALLAADEEFCSTAWMAGKDQLTSRSFKQLLEGKCFDAEQSPVFSPATLHHPLDHANHCAEENTVALGLVVALPPATVWTALGRTLQCWDARSLLLRHSLTDHKATISVLVESNPFSPRHPSIPTHRVISGDISGHVIVWDAAQLIACQQLAPPAISPVITIQSISAEELWSFHGSGVIYVWKSIEGQL